LEWVRFPRSGWPEHLYLFWHWPSFFFFNFWKVKISKLSVENFLFWRSFYPADQKNKKSFWLMTILQIAKLKIIRNTFFIRLLKSSFFMQILRKKRLFPLSFLHSSGHPTRDENLLFFTFLYNLTKLEPRIIPFQNFCYNNNIFWKSSNFSV
jgi:hypothetical protein